MSVLTAVYGTGRSLQSLVDRSQHQQSIGLRSSESRGCWLCIAGNVIGIVSGGVNTSPGSIAAKTLARQVVSKSLRTGSGVFNSVSLSNGLVNRIRKLWTRRKFARCLIWENHQFQNEKYPEKIGEVFKIFFIEDVLQKKYRISGIPKDHPSQGKFKIFKGKEKYGFTLLNLDTANTSSQDTAQIS